MDDAELSREYFKALSGRSSPFVTDESGVSQAPVGPTDWKQALDRAHELRRFEIDLSWKRASYFWAFQATSFVSIGLSSEKGLNVGVAIVASIVGAITGWVGYLSARGSKFWQENWELHVDMLENYGGDGRLTKLILGKSTDAYSLSRLNRHLLWLLTFGWLLTLVAALLFACFGSAVSSYVHSLAPCKRLLLAFACFALVITIIFVIEDKNRSDLSGEMLVGQDWCATRRKQRDIWMFMRKVIG